MTLSGTVDAGIQQIDAKGNKFTNSAGNNGSATTAFIFAGTEDLGGGKAAVFQLEIDPALADTTNRTKALPPQVQLLTHQAHWVTVSPLLA